MNGLLDILTPAILNRDTRKAALPYLSQVPGPVGIMGQTWQNVDEHGPVKGLLASAATMGTPAFVGGLLGKAAGGMMRHIFAGENAKTADKAKLQTARELEQAGADRQFIWDKTGWFKGVDGKWRFEIDDSQAAIRDKPAAHINVAAPILAKETVTDADLRRLASVKDKWKAPEFLRHNEMFDAYPNFRRDLKVEMDSSTGAKGAFDDRTGTVFFSRPEKYDIGLQRLDRPSGYDLEPTRSTNLHEFQHAIQQREGFARGGNPEQFSFSAPQRAELDRINDIINSGKYSMDEYRALLKRKLDIINSSPSSLSPHEQYRRLAGEVEARNVQSRMNMTPDERRLLPPWATMDVPENQQIIRGLLSP